MFTWKSQEIDTRTYLFDGHDLLCLVMHSLVHRPETTCAKLLQQYVLARRVAARYGVRAGHLLALFMHFLDGRRRRGFGQYSAWRLWGHRRARHALRTTRPPQEARIGQHDGGWRAKAALAGTCGVRGDDRATALKHDPNGPCLQLPPSRNALGLYARGVGPSSGARAASCIKLKADEPNTNRRLAC